MRQMIQMAVIAIATLGTGAATMTAMNQDVPDLSVPEGKWVAGSVLDGRSFHILGTDLDSGERLEDELIFCDVTFQSANCQKYCDFGWSDYKTKRDGDVIHFTARTECPDAPHTVVWYGTVQNDEVRVAGSWTTRRWYWTPQIRFSATETGRPVEVDGVSG